MKIVGPAQVTVGSLSALASACFAETFGHLYPAEDLSSFLAASYAPEVLAPQIADPAQMWRVMIEDDGSLSGYLHCGPVTLPHAEADGAGHGEIKRIYVRAGHQGKGYGHLLMTTGFAWLEATYGGAPQWLGVWSGNTKAQAFYLGLGFEKVGGYIFPVGQTLDDEYILRRMPNRMAQGST